MQHIKKLIFAALLPFVLTPAMASAQAGQEGAQPGAEPGAQQQQPGQPGAQPGEEPGAQPGAQPGAERGADPGAAQRERDYDDDPGLAQEGERMTGDQAIISQQEQETYRASDQLIGQEVRNQEDEEIGTISDLLVDREGNLKGVVVGVGGFLGVGERDVAIQWDAVELTEEEGEPRLQVDMDRQTLEQAPEFEHRDDDEGAGTW